MLNELKGIGLLLMTDARLPSVATLIAGESIRGSWWSHPRAHDIFAVLGQLEDHKDVVFTKLVLQKVTLVHRRLWSDLVSIASAGETWQTRGLSQPARHLLRIVQGENSVLSDKTRWPKQFSINIGNAVRELEGRLLIHTKEFHAKNGSHAKVLETWQHWADRIGFQIDYGSTAEAKRAFESLLTNLNLKHAAQGRLLWQTL